MGKRKVAYQITKAVSEYLEGLPAKINPILEEYTVERAFGDPNILFHRGMIKYYKKKDF